MNEVPANQYERFLLMLPEELREDCQSRLAGSGFSPDHPVFKVLADLYEKASKETGKAPQEEKKEPPPDFLGEAQLHSQLTKQLLAEFGEVPKAILGQIEPQLVGLLEALTVPVATLTATATDLQRNVEALPHLFGPKRASAGNRSAWVVSGSVCAALAVVVAGTVLYFGATSLSRHYEDSYQERLGGLEADSAEDTVTLDRLLTAGISLKVERNREGDGYFLILRGAHRAAQPVNSPEGLAVQVWP